MKTKLKLYQNDAWLRPYKEAIQGRYDYAIYKEKQICGEKTLPEFANGYLYFGLHRTDKAWIFREWAPNATAIYLIGDFNDWKVDESFALHRLDNGIWEAQIPLDAIHHGQHYKMLVRWNGGEAMRLPAWVRRCVQDEATKIYTAQVWSPQEAYEFKHPIAKLSKKQALLIYECHIGMAQEEEKVGTYEEFRIKVLPKIAANGYNAIQIMAIQEHPYYGSFGYHVSNFFAASSRFGTPEELKHLIDDAHGMGLAVIMDIVHSHAVKNTDEGLGLLDGDPGQYFHTDHRREHPAWDSLCFNYEKPEVLHFLLSNCQFWMQEYRFDGFRFDGVTSMLYKSHGLGESFNGYGDYYNLNQDGDAICYLTLANKLIHEVNPDAITIAEEVSGMPGLAAPFKHGGIGFDYRMAMGIPDYWIKIIKEKSDEDWKPGSIWWELTNRRADEKTISYAESHDQALVGDKTIIFRLIDADMYWHMSCNDDSAVVNRGMALHKMIRLLTASTINGGYLNFMGNEFGHPEWIDFPREGNGWSHKHARRQWNLAEDPNLKYKFLYAFDKAMIQLIRKTRGLLSKTPVQRCANDGDQILAFQRGKLLFVFNLHPFKSYEGYGIMTEAGKYTCVLNSDAPEFGGFGLTDDSVEHFTINDKYCKPGLEWLKLYIPARTAMVFKKD